MNPETNVSLTPAPASSAPANPVAPAPANVTPVPANPAKVRPTRQGKKAGGYATTAKSS